METLKFLYQNNEVDFEVKNQNIMINATEMAKIFGKYPKDFLILENTKSFISECLKKENSPFLGIETEEDLIVSKQKSGTWMHRILALKFAAWLNPAFELWVFSTIDKILNAYFKEQREAMVAKLSARQRRKLKKAEILEKYSDRPEIQEYFDLEQEETDAHMRRMRSIFAQMKQLKMEFKIFD